jgi:hypothetical protein
MTPAPEERAEEISKTPWRYSSADGTIRDAKDKVVAFLSQGFEIGAANGALMAAAPEMREEIRRLREVLKPFANYAAWVAEHHPGWDHDDFSVGLPDGFFAKTGADKLGAFRAALCALKSEDRS